MSNLPELAVINQLMSDTARLQEELKLLSDKSCAAVVRYRAALAKLADGFKYPTEVVAIAREALSDD